MHEVPWLRAGVGKTPAEGGCVMQVVDWISSNGWTDNPACVHPVIRSLAIEVNDRLDDQGRQQLLTLVPRMMNTAGGDEALTWRLLGYLARQSYPLYSTWVKSSGYHDGGAVLACIEAAENGEAARAAEAAWAAEAARAARAAWAAGAAEAAGAAWAAGAAEAAPDYLGLLVGLIDRYDELVPRGEQQVVDFSPVCDVLPEKHKVAVS